MLNARKPSNIPQSDYAELPQSLRCPICGDPLEQDLWWRSLHWLCPRGHSYSNVRALIAELRERGWLPPSFLPDVDPRLS